MPEPKTMAIGEIEFTGVEEGDCGCAEETFIVNGIDLVVHYEPDGRADAFMDGGDWGEADATFKLGHPEACRTAAIGWALHMTDGPEL